MERQVFLCPLCNAPHDERLQPGTLQVKCKCCGGLIVVPSRLSGLYKWCPDHPESQAVGFCTKCSRRCCDVCLHVLERTGPPFRYLCPKCTMETLKAEYSGRVLAAVLSLTLVIPMAVLLVSSPSTPWSISGYTDALAYGLFGIILVACVLLEHCANSGPIPTLRAKRHELDGRPGYAWGQCPYCNAGYFYGLSEIGSTRAVTCQNCGRRYGLGE